MKRVVLLLSLITILVGCGKENTSGRTNAFQYGNGLNASYGVINSPYNYSGNAVMSTIMVENPCGGIQGSNSRAEISLPVQLTRAVSSGNYVGVTTAGDIGILVSNGSYQATFIAYVCPRASGGIQPSVNNITTGTATGCQYPPLVSSNLYLGTTTLAFRMLDGGTNQGRPFSFCR